MTLGWGSVVPWAVTLGVMHTHTQLYTQPHRQTYTHSHSHTQPHTASQVHGQHKSVTSINYTYGSVHTCHVLPRSYVTSIALANCITMLIASESCTMERQTYITQLFTSFTHTVKPVTTDHPFVPAKAVVSSRWSLVRGLHRVTIYGSHYNDMYVKMQLIQFPKTCAMSFLFQIKQHLERNGERDRDRERERED